MKKRKKNDTEKQANLGKNDTETQKSSRKVLNLLGERIFTNYTFLPIGTISMPKRLTPSIKV